MKTKLTLTIEMNIIPQIKNLAAARGVSVSQLVEEGMKNLLLEKKTLAFGAKWKGKLAVNKNLNEIKNETRFQYLVKKYLR